MASTSEHTDPRPDGRDLEVLAALRFSPAASARKAGDVTLLELVDAASEIFANEDQVASCVSRMLQSRTARLVGNFRGAPVEAFAV